MNNKNNRNHLSSLSDSSKSDSPKSNSSNQELIDSDDYLAGAASSGDCTGLIPSAPLTDAELDSYKELYPFLPAVPKSDKN